MSVEYKRGIIGDGIALTVLKDEKFKTNCVEIRLIDKLSDETAAVNAVVANTIVSVNSNYPTRTELTKKVSSLYGSALSSSNGKQGDMQFITLKASCIRDEYALEGEKLTCEITQILLDCVFSPLLENGGFAAKEFELRKRDLIDYIDAMINDKTGYAIKKSYETVFKNEPYAINAYGSKAQAEKAEPVSAYKAFQRLLETGMIEITVAGGGDLDEAVSLVKNSFAKINRHDVIKPEFISFSKPKNELETVTETMDVNQSKLVMAYKTAYSDLYVLKVMSALLGGTAFSKLFANVREKMSLCYFCSSWVIDGKGALIIDSGVDRENIESAKKAISEQLEAVAAGDFTDEELENTKLALIGNVRSGYDSLSDLTSWYFLQLTRGRVYSCDEYIDIVNSVTREQVIESAKSFTLDTIYVLENYTHEQGGDN